jgi:ketosteroid isomerase-like protein
MWIQSLLALAWLLQAVPGDRRPADVEAIRAHIDDIYRAYMRKDRATIEATHSADWRGFLDRSRHIVIGIDDYMKGAEAFLRSPATITGYRFEEFDVVFYADVALVSYVADVDLTISGEPSKTKFRSIDIYAKRDGAWTQVGSHLNTHPDVAAARGQRPQPVTAVEREAILKQREAVWRAFFANDRARLEELVPEDTIAINAGEEIWHDQGGVRRGAEELAKSGARLVSLEFPRTEIRVYGDAVILYTTYRYELETDGKREVFSGRGTEIFVNRDGRLVNTGWHLDSGK